MSTEPATTDLLRALAAVLGTFGGRWYVFGAQAVLVWGRPRLTGDVDVTIFLDPEDNDAFVAAMAPAALRAREAIGWRHLVLDAKAGTVRFAREGVRIDLGGFAKGHAVDNCVAILQQHGIGQAIVSAGGDSRVLGDRRGRPWTIAIRDPRHSDGVVAVLPLEDVSISTSGDYERYFEEDGVRFHHLIDPHTGASPNGVRSVTILAPDGLTSEALSKTVFVLGAKRGFELVESFPDVDAVVVDATGVLRFSRGLMHGASARLQ